MLVVYNKQNLLGGCLPLKKDHWQYCTRTAYLISNCEWIVPTFLPSVMAWWFLIAGRQQRAIRCGQIGAFSVIPHHETAKMAWNGVQMQSPGFNLIQLLCWVWIMVCRCNPVISPHHLPLSLQRKQPSKGHPSVMAWWFLVAERQLRANRMWAGLCILRDTPPWNSKEHDSF